MATVLDLCRVTKWQSRPGPIVGHPWSANDIAMVIGWVAILPHAATSFEHDILVPPVSHLSAGGNFLVAAAAVLAELAIAALLARMLGSVVRKALRRAVCFWRARRSSHHDRRPARIRFRRRTRMSSAPGVETYSWRV